MKETEPHPRPASTLVIVRDTEGSFEVLLTKRPESLRFMGGATVFPGGSMSEADRDPAGAGAMTPEAAAELLELDDPREALGYLVCACREAFEEVGLIVEVDRLTPAGRWVTPLGSPIRFDTRFFITPAPEGWEPRPDPGEVAGCTWMTARAALEELAEGRLLMAPPTVEMLQRLSEHSSVGEAIDSLSRHSLAGAGNTLSMSLSPLVHVVLAPNPGLLTGPGTNTYIVGGERKAVIDPAVTDEAYLDAILGAAPEIDVILVTHRHPDHVGGIEALVERTGAVVRAFGSHDAGGVEVTPLVDGESIDLGGAALRTFHTPGHSADHVVFYLEGAATLFAGDNILGEGTAVIAPPDGDMGEYLASLVRLLELHIDRIYPGHFRPLNGGHAVIQGYIDHRRMREAQVMSAIGPRGATLEEIVEAVYADTPAQLHPIARLQVEAQLAWMLERGMVSSAEERWKLTSVD